MFCATPSFFPFLLFSILFQSFFSHYACSLFSHAVPSTKTFIDQLWLVFQAFHAAPFPLDVMFPFGTFLFTRSFLHSFLPFTVLEIYVAVSPFSLSTLKERVP